MLRRTAIIALVTMGMAAVCAAQAPPDYDFQWRTIGAPGNRAVNQTEAPHLYPPYIVPAFPLGAVPYTYRMSQREVTVQQYFEFVNAYWPYFNGNYADVNFTSMWIRPAVNIPGQNPQYYIVPGTAQHAADMSWRIAARYANWLTNNKATTQAAFENGAYDTSTFSSNPDGSINDQRVHSPGATFWIPTLDEWTKSMYFSPDRYGPGLDGYWRYPTSSDTAPIYALPQNGGQSSGGLFGIPMLNVGSYPSVQSPWQLLDGSGSVEEWNEDLLGPPFGFRALNGSSQDSGGSRLYDSVDMFDNEIPNAGGFGLRLASAIPSPGSAAIVVAALLGGIARRSRWSAPRVKWIAALLPFASQALAQTPSCQLGTLAVYITPSAEGSCSIEQGANGSYGVIIQRSQHPNPYLNPVAVEVLGTTGQERISSVYVTYGGTPPWSYSVTNLTVHASTALGRVSSVGSISRASGQALPCVLDMLKVSGDLGEYNGEMLTAIDVERIVEVRVAGNVLGNIRAHFEDLYTDHAIPAIDRIIVGGDLKADIVAGQGSINRIDVTGDVLGGPDAGKAAIQAAGVIGRLTGRSIRADVLTTPGTLFDPNVVYVQTTNGNFVGSLRTNFLAPTEFFPQDTPYVMDIAGDLDGIIFCDEFADRAIRVGGRITPQGRIRVGGFHGSSMSIGASNGLQGQVIINGGAAANGTWEPPVTVGSTELLPRPHYANHAADIGGGAAGLVPYALHDTDCVPPNSNNAGTASFVLIPPSQEMPPVLLPHFGPIKEVEDSVPPIVIEIRVGEPPYAWKEITPAFDVTVRPSGVPGGQRTVRIGTPPGSGPGMLGTFRVTPVPGRLVCDDENGLIVSPNVDVKPWTYYFRLVPDCNGNGVADPNEIAAAMSEGLALDCNNNGYMDWCDINMFHNSTDNNGDGIPDECTQPTCRADFDHSGHVDPQDIAAFITQWYFDLNSGNPPSTHLADFNLDYLITPADVSLFVGVWFANVAQGC